jgi:uncharacterized BrkB/YihY/UPF0761 family membrane protein
MTTPTRTPEEEHRRQMLWQVWLPLIVVLLIALSAAVFTVVGASGGADISVWSGISVIWMVLPLIFVLLVNLILVSVVIFFLPRLIRKLPLWAMIARARIAQINAAILGFALKATTPVVEVKSRMAGIRSVFDRFKKPPSAV